MNRAVRVIVAGCGRVGGLLATRLDADGHDVVIIDRNPDAFERLGDGYAGRTLEGVVFDRLILEEAGITRADAFVAVTSGDNSNIVAARTAKERFGIDGVVARIYDPVRAAIYERLGVTTIASAQWTAEEVLRSIRARDEYVVAASLGPGAGDVVVVTLPVPPEARAAPLSDLEEPGARIAVAVTREGRTSVPHTGALLEGGDLVHLAVSRDDLDKAREAVAALGEGSP